MSLSRTVFNTVKRFYASAFDDIARVAFTKAPPAEQLAKLRAAVPPDAADDLAIACFIFVIHVRSKLVLPGSPEHFALRTSLGIPEVKPWHKARPPKTSWEMQDSNRVPAWIEETQAMGAIARTITWDDVRTGPDMISAAVRVFFKFGGIEDLGDPRAIQANDPTMRLFLEGIGYSLAIMRPEWHDVEGIPLKDLPAGVDGRSQLEIDTEKENTERIRHNEEQRERTRARREKEIAEYGALRTKILTDFRSDKTAALADQISKLPFDEAKDTHEAMIATQCADVISAVFDALSLALVLPEGLSADEIQAIRKETTEKANALVVQLVLEDVNDIQESWFRCLTNGDFRFRPQPLKAETRPPGYASKKEKAASRAISKIFLDYGEDVLNFALQTIVGQKLAGPAKIVTPPDWLKHKGAEEVTVGVNGGEGSQPPPPPAPPGGELPPPPPPPAGGVLG